MMIQKIAFPLFALFVSSLLTGCGSSPISMDEHLKMYRTAEVANLLGKTPTELENELAQFEETENDYYRKESDVGGGGKFIAQFEFIARPGQERLPLRRYHQATKLEANDAKRARELFDALIAVLNEANGVAEVDMYAGEETHTWKKDNYEISAYIREMGDYTTPDDKRKWQWVTLNYAYKGN